jgi:hypothetical protein
VSCSSLQLHILPWAGYTWQLYLVFKLSWSCSQWRRFCSRVRPEKGLYETETETEFYKRQFHFFQPELEFFFTIPVPVETEPEFQILISVLAKPEPEIDFCRISGCNMPEFDHEFCEKHKENLKSVYFGLKSI